MLRIFYNFTVQHPLIYVYTFITLPQLLFLGFSASARNITSKSYNSPRTTVILTDPGIEISENVRFAKGNKKKESYTLPDSSYHYFSEREVNQSVQKTMGFTLHLKFKFRAVNDSIHDLYLYMGSFDHLIATVCVKGEPQQVFKSGSLETHPFFSDFLKDNVIKISVKKNQNVRVFLKIDQYCNNNHLFSGIHLYSVHSWQHELEHYQYKNRNFNFIDACFLGFLICQVTIIGVQYFFTNRIEYFYYAAHIGSVLLFVLFHEDRYIYSSFGHVYLAKGCVIMSSFFYFRFYRHFLAIQDRFPRITTSIKFAEYYLLFYFCVNLIWIGVTKLDYIQDIVYTLSFLVTFIFTIFLLIFFANKAVTLFPFIMMGALIMTVSIVLAIAFSDFQIDLLGNQNYFIYAQIGIVSEIIALSTGLSYKAKTIEIEKNRSQIDLITQLEANLTLKSKLEQLRNKISMDLHDEIGASLNAILLYANLALSKSDKLLQNETVRFFEKIKTGANALIMEVSEIAWMVNEGNDSMATLVDKMKSFVGPLLEATGILYQFNVGNNLDSLQIDMETRRNCFLVFKEAINNVVKYAQCTNLTIEIAREEKNIYLFIKDNGIGFIKNQISRTYQDTSTPRKGNGLIYMQRRANEIKGDLQIFSNLNDGTSIMLRWPILSSAIEDS